MMMHFERERSTKGRTIKARARLELRSDTAADAHQLGDLAILFTNHVDVGRLIRSMCQFTEGRGEAGDLQMEARIALRLLENES
jgi:hypothetical protein